MEPRKKKTTHAEHCKAYRERKKAGIPVSKPPPKTKAQIQKAYRERRKMKRIPEIQRTDEDQEKIKKTCVYFQSVIPFVDSSSKDSTMVLYEITYGDYKIPVCKNEKGDLWYKGQEIASILNYKDTAHAIKKRVSAENKLPWRAFNYKTSIYPSTIFVNEAGLNDLGINSDEPEAVDFRQWMASNLLPLISKTGVSPQPTENEMHQQQIETEEMQRQIKWHNEEMHQQQIETEETQRQQMKWHNEEMQRQQLETEEKQQQMKRHNEEMQRQQLETEEKQQQMKRHNEEMQRQQLETEEKQQQMKRHNEEMQRQQLETEEKQQQMKRYNEEMQRQQLETEEKRQQMKRHNEEMQRQQLETEEMRRQLKQNNEEMWQRVQQQNERMWLQVQQKDRKIWQQDERMWQQAQHKDKKMWQLIDKLTDHKSQQPMDHKSQQTIDNKIGYKKLRAYEHILTIFHKGGEQHMFKILHVQRCNLQSSINKLIGFREVAQWENIPKSFNIEDKLLERLQQYGIKFKPRYNCFFTKNNIEELIVKVVNELIEKNQTQ